MQKTAASAHACVAECFRVEKALKKAAERLIEDGFLSEMRIEERRQRAVEKEIARRKRETKRRADFLDVCRVAWRIGVEERKLEVSGAEAERLRQERRRERIAKEKREKLEKEVAERQGSYMSPWEAARGGASLGRFDALVQEERERKEFQEGRVWNYDFKEQESGETLLHSAVRNSQDALAKHLLEVGASPNVDDNTICRVTPLHDAVVKRDLELVRTLMKGGAKVHLADARGDTALHYACRQNSVAIISELLEKAEAGDLGMPQLYQMVAARDARGRRASWHLLARKGHPAAVPKGMPAKRVRAAAARRKRRGGPLSKAGERLLRLMLSLESEIPQRLVEEEERRKRAWAAGSVNRKTNFAKVKKLGLGIAKSASVGLMMSTTTAIASDDLELVNKKAGTAAERRQKAMKQKKAGKKALSVLGGAQTKSTGDLASRLGKKWKGLKR